MFNDVVVPIDDDYDDFYHGSCWELTKKPLGSKCRALKCTLLIIFNLFLLACTIGLLVPLILYIREEPSTPIPLIVMFAVCCVFGVCFNFIMCLYFGCFYASVRIGSYFTDGFDD